MVIRSAPYSFDLVYLNIIRKPKKTKKTKPSLNLFCLSSSKMKKAIKNIIEHGIINKIEFGK